MIAFKLTFNGTEEQFMAGAIANGYEKGDVHQFVAGVLMYVSPFQYVKTATEYWEKRKGAENYDANAMFEAMKNLITIEYINE